MNLLYKDGPLHLTGWAGFILVETLGAYFYYGKLENFHDYAGHYLINITLFYATFFLVPLDIFKLKSVLILLLRSVPLFMLYILARKALLLVFEKANLPYYNLYPNNITFFVLSFSRGLGFYAMGLFLAMLQRFYQSELRLKDLLIEGLKDRATIRDLELANLQSKMNPHLVFNTLGIIHNAALKESKDLPRLIELLSEVMEYGLKKADEDGKVALKDEIRQIDVHVDLNRLRMGSNFSFEYRIEGNISYQRILPMSLVSIAENLFKYGRLCDREHPAFIEIKIKSNELFFRSFNAKKGTPTYKSHKTGMETLQKRLAHYYPQQHELEIDDQPGYYMIKLWLKELY